MALGIHPSLLPFAYPYTCPKRSPALSYLLSKMGFLGLCPVNFNFLLGHFSCLPKTLTTFKSYLHCIKSQQEIRLHSLEGKRNFLFFCLKIWKNETPTLCITRTHLQGGYTWNGSHRNDTGCQPGSKPSFIAHTVLILSMLQLTLQLRGVNLNIWEFRTLPSPPKSDWPLLSLISQQDSLLSWAGTSSLMLKAWQIQAASEFPL